MTRATQILNDYHIKTMLLSGNPQFDNFYKEELVRFCKVAKNIIKEQQDSINKATNDLAKIEENILNGTIIGLNQFCPMFNQICADLRGDK